MKNHLLHSFVFLSLSLVANSFWSCCKDKAELTLCIQDKIEAWKTEPGAFAIYEIDAPDGKLYWFGKSCVDCGDYIYNTNCEEVCITNLEGYEPGVNFCDQAVLVSPRTTIWEK